MSAEINNEKIFELFERQVDSLIAKYQEIKKQNAELRTKQTDLLKERDHMLNERDHMAQRLHKATSTVEGLLNRLKVTDEGAK